MTETRKRIKIYKEHLLGLREKVFAVALLLVMSTLMLVSASYAWLTISLRPELNNVHTTVAANGNLEVALVPADGSLPGPSLVGDSLLSVLDRNTTWGNLINLSDPAYGLENLVLRPAQLNTSSLLDSPLYGAVYGEDGRITHLTSNFGYAVWTPPTGDLPGYFGVSTALGVRAISSTKIEAVGAEGIYLRMLEDAKSANLAAANLYTSLGNNGTYMQSLATMMGLYMTARMNPSNASLSNPSCDIADIQNLRDMYAGFLDAFDAEADAMAKLANLQLFLKHGDGNYTPYTAEMIYAATPASLQAQDIQISNLQQFLNDHNVIVTDLEKLNVLCTAGTSLAWVDSGLNGIVNNLVNVGACTIGADNTPISSIGASNALGYLTGTQEARITNGILYRFEERTGGYIQVKNLGISATVERGGFTVPATVRANIQTTASRDYNLFGNDLQATEDRNDGNFAGGVAVAEDTYGLAIDLWARTNAAGSYLTLEGNVITEDREVDVYGRDASGAEVLLYAVTISGTDEDGVEFSYVLDLYQRTEENGDTAWINADNHQVVTDEELNGAVPIQKKETIQVVIGYEGENRVWEDNALLSSDATTQGSGSCYVYYADTPEDQARSLALLESFNVAFVDEEGKLLATAYMDTERYYAVNGRVIVPLVLGGDSINLGEDAFGNVTYAITSLEQNVPTRITAIVYLDGTKLTNEEVLAAADIQGQLNIQFGSSVSLEPIENEELENAERSVSASVNVSQFDYDTAEGPMTTTVTVNVAGDQPSTLTAFFIRAINSTQGSREETMTFTRNADGTWTSDYTFTSPGEYVLRTVRLDGVDYDLETCPTVTVSGFAIRSLGCTQSDENRHITVMTADNSFPVDLTLQFATNDPDKMPNTVQGRFLRSDGIAVNINFTLNPTTQIWTGSANFLNSGDYTLQYLILDGEYAELDESLWQTATIYLGMRAVVYTTSPQTFKFVPSEMADNERMLAMQVMIVDNAGNEMPGLSGVKLTYGMRGSGIQTMDADLVWNGSYYVGELLTAKPGIFQFASLTVGSNVITNATTSPTFTILSPEPPAYYSSTTQAFQFSPDDDARFTVQISNSSAATVQALIRDAAGNEYEVIGELGSEFSNPDDINCNSWYFTVPNNEQGHQDGQWTLVELRLWDVFDADGNAYTEDSPMVIDVARHNVTSRVLSQTNVYFAEDLSEDFTGTFMQSHTISGLNVNITDWLGGAMVDNDGNSLVESVTLKYIYGNNSAAYGGYTRSDLNNAIADFTIELTDDGSGIRFVQTQDVTILYAGSYTTELEIVVNGRTITYSGRNLPEGAPVFTVSSVTPAVTLASRTTYEGSSTNGSTITVAYGHSTETACGFTYHNYSQPNVEFTLSGYGNASGAALVFTESNGGAVRLFVNREDADNQRTDRFTWTGDGNCTRWVGYWNSQTGTDRATAAGTIVATHLTLTYGGVDYLVDIDDITIINPTPPS